MKKYQVNIIIFFFLFLGMTCSREVAEAKEVRGIWVSCFDYAAAGLANQTEAGFREHAVKLFQNIKANGCNTVFFHVRSFDDVIYPSQTFSFSPYMSRSKLTYDPLAILVTQAHQNGLEFHAWLNPYRVTYSKILNPALESSRERVLQAVREIIMNYDVDGIHFDDYFYPSGSNKEYKKYKTVSIADKQNNVNLLIQSVYQLVKKTKPSLDFGISPAGDISYSKSIGADMNTWMSQRGYIDYIIPQIYWTDNYLVDGKETSMFSNRVNEWKTKNKIDVKMYWGLALYRSGMTHAQDLGWKKRSNNLAIQVAKLRKLNSDGFVFFSYQDLYQHHAWAEWKNVLYEIGSITKVPSNKKMSVGQRFTIQYEVWPSRMEGKVTFESSNPKVAHVNSTGVVQAKRTGSAKVWIKLGKHKKVSCTISVSLSSVKKIFVKKKSKKRIKIFWNKTIGAKSYQIYMKIRKKASYQRVKTVRHNSAVISYRKYKKKKFWLKVKACAGGYSSDSKTLTLHV